MKRAHYQAEEREKKLIAKVLELMEEAPLSTGAVVLKGEEQNLKLSPRTNVTYEKEGKGDEHPLRALLGQFDLLGDMIRVEYKESGQKIQNMLDSYVTSPEETNDEIADLCKALMVYRRVKAGKPGVEIVDRLD